MRRFLSKLASSLRGANTTRAARRGLRRVPLQVEALEERRLMSFTPSLAFSSARTSVPLALLDPIQAEYRATAGETDSRGVNVQQMLGAPTSGEVAVPWVPGALMQTYEQGTIYWSGSYADSAHVVYGTIGAKYDSLGGAGGTHFLFHSGRFGETSTWVTLAPGYGLPTSDEADVPGVPGERVSYFQNGGAIYWRGGDAFEVHGAIGAEYQAPANATTALNDPVQGVLGAPTSDETDVPNVSGARMNSFEHGAIFWSPNTPAAAVYGPIGDAYFNAGGPAGALGLPVNDEHDVFAGREQDFQHGKIIGTAQGARAYAFANTSFMTFGSGYIGFSDGTPVGGSVQVSVSQDGSFQIEGSLHNSGFFTEDDKIVITLVSPTGRQWQPPIHEAHMGGTIDFGTNGPRDDVIDVHNKDAVLANGWTDFVGGVMVVTTTANVDVGDAIAKAAIGVAAVGAAWGFLFKSDKGKGNADGGDTSQVVAGDGLPNGGTVALGDPNNDPNWGTIGDTGAMNTDPNAPHGVWSTEAFIPAVNGYAVTLDASALGVPNVSLDGTVYDATAPFVANLLPGQHTLTTNGTDVTAFTVNADGTVSYDDAPPGVFTGSGTTALTVNGFAVALDATALGVTGLALDGMTLNGAAPSSANLLPGTHTLTTNGTDVTAFTVNADGTVSYDDAPPGVFTGSGTTALTVNGFAVTLDATALGVASITVDGVSHDATALCVANLLPGQHTLTTNGTDVTAFTVNPDGTVSYDSGLGQGGVLAGSGTTALAVNGYAVTLDATALGVANLYVDGVAHDATAPFVANLLPGQHSLSTNGTDVIWFTVNPDGTVAYDPALEGTLTGSGSTSLVFPAP